MISADSLFIYGELIRIGAHYPPPSPTSSHNSENTVFSRNYDIGNIIGS